MICYFNVDFRVNAVHRIKNKRAKNTLLQADLSLVVKQRLNQHFEVFQDNYVNSRKIINIRPSFGGSAQYPEEMHRDTCFLCKFQRKVVINPIQEMCGPHNILSCLGHCLLLL